ncbi:MAG TPA: hypothetical protein VFB99_00055 [Vicinamibacterales bacterium]|nr:hypothetical protein [Vicinamibacterales bacterium]
MKVFLDTNVLVSAFAARGICEDVLRIVLAEHQLVVARADFLVTGDHDLLVAAEVSVTIVSPREFWERLR